MSDSTGPKKETVRITLPPRAGSAGIVGNASRDTARINLPGKAPMSSSAVEAPKRVLPPPPPPKRMPPPPPGARVTVPISVAPPIPPRVVPPPPPAPISRAESAAPTLPPVAPLPPTMPASMPPRPRILPPPPRVMSPGAAARSVAAAPSNYPGSATQAGPRKETARITILPEPTPSRTPTVKMAKTQPLLTVPSSLAPSAPILVSNGNEAAVPVHATSMFDSVPLPICWTIFGISALTLLIQIWNYFGS
jgi:hypothetical protein